MDAVWGERTLAEALGPDTKVDYVLASHVVEHVPDLISWLQELRAVLKPGGQVRLVVPDKRFTFDLYRRETVLSDVLAAHLVRARKPLLPSVVDFVLFSTTVDHMKAWNGEMPAELALTRERFNWAYHVGRDVIDHDNYHDVHCWVVTPRSFAMLFAEMAEFGLLDFSCAAFHDTEPCEIEFFVVLQQSADPAEMAESWRRMSRAARPRQSWQRPACPRGHSRADRRAPGKDDRRAQRLGCRRAGARQGRTRPLLREIARRAGGHERWKEKSRREAAEAKADEPKPPCGRRKPRPARPGDRRQPHSGTGRAAELRRVAGDAPAPRLVEAGAPAAAQPGSPALGRGIGGAARATRRRGRRRQREQVARIEASPLFDAGWYVREYRDLQGSNISPGAALPAARRQPRAATRGPISTGPGISQQNRDVAAAGVNPLLHFIEQGKPKGARPSRPETRETRRAAARFTPCCAGISPGCSRCGPSRRRACRRG